MQTSSILGPFDNERGGTLFKSLIFILILASSIYVGVQFGKPYFAYKSLERSMQYWAETCLTPRSLDRESLTYNVMEKVKKHGIPLTESKIKIDYDQSEKTVSVWAEYDIVVKLPWYEKQLHFSPKAHARAVDM